MTPPIYITPRGVQDPEGGVHIKGGSNTLKFERETGKQNQGIQKNKMEEKRGSALNML